MHTKIEQSETAGWRARLALDLSSRGPRTVLSNRLQRGPLAVQRPFYPEGDLCHLYLLHPPGGVVGGDRLSIRAQAHQGAAALITTPGATKFYRSAGPQADQQQRLTVAAGASLEWLPQENIIFPGANIRSSTHIDLDPQAKSIGWELHCLGRPANREGFDVGHADLSLRLYLGGDPLLLERLRIDGAESVNGAARLRGQPVVGTLWAYPADKALVSRLRASLTGDDYGVTLIENLLLLRYLGPSTEAGRRLFTQAWSGLRTAILGRPACRPRIWST